MNAACVRPVISRYDRVLDLADDAAVYVGEDAAPFVDKFAGVILCAARDRRVRVYGFGAVDVPGKIVF